MLLSFFKRDGTFNHELFIDLERVFSVKMSCFCHDNRMFTREDPGLALHTVYMNWNLFCVHASALFEPHIPTVNILLDNGHRPRAFLLKEPQRLMHRFQCIHCGLIFIQRSHAVRHDEACLSDNYCGSSFFNVNLMRYHIDHFRFGSDFPSTFFCDMCNKYFRSDSALEKHKRYAQCILPVHFDFDILCNYTSSTTMSKKEIDDFISSLVHGPPAAIPVTFNKIDAPMSLGEMDKFIESLLTYVSSCTSWPSWSSLYY